MRKIFLLLYSLSLFASPMWFYNLPQEKNQIIGYGSGESDAQAWEDAVAQITKTLWVEVDTTTQISKASLEDGSFNKNISSNLQTKAKATLSGTKTLKSEQIEGVWYVAVAYDNTPLELKLKKYLPQNITNQKQHSYLAHTSLFETLNKTLGIKVDFQIVRQNNLWQIAYEDILEVLNQEQFYNLFANYADDMITLQTNQPIYKENDTMSFTLKTNQSGYISLLYVEHDGKTGVIFENRFAQKELQYPQDKSEEKLTIFNPYGKPIEELYIVIYSKERLDLREFESVSESYLDGSNYNFDKLLKLIDNKKIATVKIKIRGEK